MRPSTSKLQDQPRGYVLFIVMVVGLAAGLAAAALVSASGGARVNSMHTDDSNIASAIAEAGMNHAMAYVEAVSSTSADFDALLDVDLNTGCGSALAGSDPDNGTDFIPALSGGASVAPTSLGGRYFTRISDFNGGAYFIRFDDDDDDTIHTEEWREITGNNEISGCVEGDRGDDSVTGNDANGRENRLRDRNRTIWITVVGVYPGNDADAATHRSVMRSLYAGPRPPSLAGIRIKGDLDPSGGTQFLACSAIGAVEIDGKAEGGGSATCASGHSNANKWNSNWKGCADPSYGTSPCELIPAEWGSISPAPGRLDTPGPDLPDMPDVWDDADEFIDWSRPCVFWNDNGGGMSGAGRDSLWFWDAHREYGGGKCSDFEGTANSFPGPPDPSRANGGGWEGCWTPILLDAASPNSAVTPPSSLQSGVNWVTALGAVGTDTQYIAPTGASGTPSSGPDGMDDGGCWSIPWLDPTGTGPPIFYEKSLTPGGACSWHPKAQPGVYVTCDDITSGGVGTGTLECGPRGRFAAGFGIPATEPWPTSVEYPYGSLNAKLRIMGLPTFPDGTRLQKPNWQTECSIDYPTAFSGLPVNTYGCSTCTTTNGVTSGVDDYAALTYIGASVKMLWPSPNENGDLTALPAGVYYFSDGFNLSGSPSDWTGVTRPWQGAGAGVPDSANPLVSMAKYPLMTFVSDKKMNLQQLDYFTGIGQVSPAGESECTSALPSATAYLRVPSGCAYTPQLDPQPQFARWASWITSDKLTLQGGSNNTYAGSIYAGNGVEYKGSTSFYVYGELYTDANVKVGGSSSFFWLYQVPLSDPGQNSYGGTLPTTFKTSH